MKVRTVQELFSLKGKTAVVTGGSRGLGLQMAEALGEQGARVLLTSRKQAELDEACKHLAARGIEALAIVSDLGSEAGVSAFAEAALAQLGHADILVNNAGATWGAPAEDYPLDAWDKVMNLNVRSTFLLCQAFGRGMIARGEGRIVNIASIAGLAGNPPGSMQTIAYNTSKAAVINFTRTLAGEWGRHGITVNAIAPGFFPSKMTKGILAAVGADTLAQQAPLGRLGGDEDLKGAVVLFASDAGRHITGQVLAVDGGVSAV
jgi:gluconate 5-dehydrogenase